MTDAASWLTAHAHEENSYLTTTGRRTGRPHEVEIWFGVLGTTAYIVSGGGDPADWYRNALSTGRVTVRIGGETHDGSARAVTDAAERRAAGEVMQRKYAWDGDESIGLTPAAWAYERPMLAVDF